MRIIRNVAAIAVAALLAPSVFAATLGPSAYSTPANSPFSPFAGFAYFHLETFDDHALNTPGVSASTGASTANSGFNGPIIDQVGLAGGCPVGGLAVACDTWFSGSGAVQFTFNAAALGQLPNAVGLVWTDGVNPIAAQAFDQNGISLGIIAGNHADGSFFGTTDEDRFYGFTASGGISSIVISNVGGGIEIDDLQYGFRGAPSAAPEPGTLALLSLALLGLAGTRRRG